MKNTCTRQLLLVCVASLLVQICGVNAQAQQQTKDPAQPKSQQQTDDDVIRISTDLMQTGVSVFDKRGNFVEGLKQEDFELKVDGRPVEVGFFERIASGSVGEEAQIAAARGGSSAKLKEPAKDSVAAAPRNRRRVIIFFRR